MGMLEKVEILYGDREILRNFRLMYQWSTATVGPRGVVLDFATIHVSKGKILATSRGVQFNSLIGMTFLNDPLIRLDFTQNNAAMTVKFSEFQNLSSITRRVQILPVRSSLTSSLVKSIDTIVLDCSYL